MTFYFDRDLAITFGVERAVLISHLSNLIKKNADKGKGLHDGKYWTRTSVLSLSVQLPFFSQKQIRDMLKFLEYSGVVVAGDFNKNKYDRTKWYTLGDFIIEAVGAKKYNIADTINQACDNFERNVFISKYLIPGNLGSEEQIKAFVSLYIVNRKEVPKGIKEHILKMPYSDFLKTIYWRGISYAVRTFYGHKCQICGEKCVGDTHHVTYENHGDEVHHLEDLVCICRECHEKLHKIEK